MRVMEIPPFPERFENPSDLTKFLQARLSQTVVLWPNQAIPLVGYMGWPNDLPRREESLRTIKSWQKGLQTVPPRLRRIQHEWLRVADVFHHYCDLIDRQYQKQRGGPSIGKAITLVAGKAESRGTKPAYLWHYWKRYKDVAHLVTAAALICAQARDTLYNVPFQPGRLGLNQCWPFQMAMLVPDLVLAVALEFEQHGLTHVLHARNEPAFDPETIWRIPPDINVAPIPPRMRKLTARDFEILGARRAGNRGRANRRKTTPVSG